MIETRQFEIKDAMLLNAGGIRLQLQEVGEIGPRFTITYNKGKMWLETFLKTPFDEGEFLTIKFAEERAFIMGNPNIILIPIGKAE